MTQTTTLAHLVAIAQDLKSEDGENPEYDRALIELIRDAFGIGYDMDDGRVIVERMIRPVKHTVPDRGSCSCGCGAPLPPPGLCECGQPIGH